MPPGQQWVPWEITQDSWVACESKKALTKEIPKAPQLFKSFLQFLEGLGHVRAKLHLHEITRQQGSSGQYDIKPTDTAVLDVKVQDFSEKFNLRSIANALRLADLKQSKYLHIVHRLQYDSSTNKITSGYPGIYVKKAIRVKMGELFKLV